MVLLGIYSVFYYLGLTVSFVFKFSTDISPSVCGYNASSSGVVRIGSYRPPRSEVSYTFGVGVRFLPASPRHRQLHLPLRCRFPLIFYFGRSSIIRLKCPGLFRPICRICHQDLGDSVFLGLISQLVLMAGSFRVFLSV